jgi:hypothetical protein
LAFYRNDADINQAYRDTSVGPDYREVFTTAKPWHFDEWPGIYRILEARGARILLDNALTFDVDPKWPTLKATTSTGWLNCYEWSEGRVFEVSPRGRRESAAVHLQKRPFARLPEQVSTGHAFGVAPGRFFTLPSGPVSALPAWHYFPTPLGLGRQVAAAVRRRRRRRREQF